jgi:alkaline phosphatase
LGNHENIEIGSFLAEYLDVDVEAITKKLQLSSSFTTTSSADKAQAQAKQPADFSWMGDPLGIDLNVDHIDMYHGDFRKRSLSAEDSTHNLYFSSPVAGSDGGCTCGRKHR